MKQLGGDNNHQNAFNSILCWLQSLPRLCSRQAGNSREVLVENVSVQFLDHFVLGMEVVKETWVRGTRSAPGHRRILVLGLASSQWSLPGPLFLLGAWVGAAAAASIHSACLRGKGREDWDNDLNLLSKSSFPALVPRTKSELPSYSGEEQRRDPSLCSLTHLLLLWTQPHYPLLRFSLRIRLPRPGEDFFTGYENSTGKAEQTARREGYAGDTAPRRLRPAWVGQTK